MSASPIEMPGASVAVLSLCEAPLPDVRRSRERNESSYRTTCAVQGLPEAHIAVQATESAVLVTATDISVIADWLFVMGGTITTVDLPSGQTVWTLRTTTWTDSDEVPAVPVHVTVVQATGEPVMCEIADAVRAS